MCLFNSNVGEYVIHIICKHPSVEAESGSFLQTMAADAVAMSGNVCNIDIFVLRGKGIHNIPRFITEVTYGMWM